MCGSQVCMQRWKLTHLASSRMPMSHVGSLAPTVYIFDTSKVRTYKCAAALTRVHMCVSNARVTYASHADHARLCMYTGLTHLVRGADSLHGHGRITCNGVYALHTFTLRKQQPLAGRCIASPFMGVHAYVVHGAQHVYGRPPWSTLKRVVVHTDYLADLPYICETRMLVRYVCTCIDIVTF